eukprot:scaffold1265_cov38-Cyclotella_meneghiniana.AAC.12
MSSIADSVLNNPRKAKADARRKKALEEYHKAQEKSVYHWVDVTLIASGFRHNDEIRAFTNRCRDGSVNKRTPQIIEERDRLLSKYLPQLQTAGLVPTYTTSYIHTVVKEYPDDEELQAFWADYCQMKVLTKARANFQN